MTHKRVGLIFSLAILLIPEGTYAGCISDCRDEYEAARDDCITTYDDPDDADDLQLCLENAKSAYDDCLEECRS